MKTAGRDAPAVSSKLQRLKSLLRFTHRRRAQNIIHSRQDGFHFFVPPFRKNLKMRVYHPQWWVSRRIKHADQRLELTSIPGAANTLLNEKAFGESPCLRKYSSRSLPSCGSGKCLTGIHHKA